MSTDKNQTPKRLYTTAIIEQLIADSNMGLEIDTAPFYMGDTELRAANIVFEYTPEEIEEFQKCMMDPVYFVKTYCKFQNDKGRTLVELRDFQEEIIHSVCDSHYDEELDEMIPDNRNNVIMASRQVGKCVLPISKIETKNGSQCLGDIYQKHTNKTFLSKIKMFLYKIYAKL